MKPESLRVAVDDGTRLHVRHWPAGPGGRTYLLVHGLSSNARLWDGVAGRLASLGHACYAVDLRSHGGSDRPATGYDTATAAADLAALAVALDLPPAVVAGHSWGGNVVVRFAAGHPDRVASLYLVDGGWRDLREHFASWEDCAARLRPHDIDGSDAARMRDAVERAHPDWEPWAVDATLANVRVDAAGKVWRRLPVPEHMQILRSMWDDPPQPYYPDITVPVTAIAAGSNDPTRDVEGLSHARVRLYPGADHDVQAQHPAEVATDLLEPPPGR